MNRALWKVLVGLPALVFIVALGGGIWILSREAPRAAPFGSVPPFEAMEGPALGLGDTTLDGQIVDAAGEPISDATVITTQGRRVRRSVTDASGEFQLTELATGTVDLTVLVMHRLPTTVTVAVGAGSQRITISNPVQKPPTPVQPAASDLELELLLPDPGDSPEGMTLAFEPVGNPSVGERAPLRVALTNRTHITVPDLAHGTWTLRLLPKNGVQDLDWDLLQPVGKAPMRLTHPGPEPLPLIAHTGTIEGTLKDANGQPISGALVLVHPAQGEGPTLPPQRTSTQGRVRFDFVPSGDWIVRWRARRVGGEGTVSVERGQVTDPFP